MNIYIKLLMSITTLTLVSCGGISKPTTPTKNAPIENPVIEIVPSHGSAPIRYCKRSGDNLVVTFRNTGNWSYSGGSDVTVTFGNAAVGPMRMPAIQPNTSINMNFKMPSCFSPDCYFSIKWSNQPAVSGICIG